MTAASLGSAAFLIALALVTLSLFTANRKLRKGQEPFQKSERGALTIAAIALALAAIVAAFFPGVELPPQNRETTFISANEKVEPTPTVCLVHGFPDGKHQIPDARLPAMPQGCLDDLISALKVSTPRQIVLIGHADKRELSASAARYYGENGSLALTRAQAVRILLSTASAKVQSTTIVLSAGARNVGNQVSPDLLAKDRSVEIFVYWNPQTSTSGSQPHRAFGWSLNTDVLDSGVSLTLLGFLVALSAYLATIRLFVKQQATSNRVKRLVRLSFITAADLPMILATLFLGLHVFLFLSAAWLRASLVLFLFAGLVMIVLHSVEWAESIVKMYRGVGLSDLTPAPPVSTPMNLVPPANPVPPADPTATNHTSSSQTTAPTNSDP